MSSRPLPPALPPAERTVGQLVGETIKLYGSHFWPSLALGTPIAVVDLASFHRSVLTATLLLWAFSPLLTLATVAGSAIALGVRPSRRRVAVALVAGVIVFLPFPILVRLYILPGLAWFGLFGLAVPAAIREELDVRGALRRGFELGRADPLHAVAGIATLALVYKLSQFVLVELLHSQGDQTQEIAGVLADVVLSPLVFLGPGLLYVDQAARVRLGAPDRGGA